MIVKYSFKNILALLLISITLFSCDSREQRIGKAVSNPTGIRAGEATKKIPEENGRKNNNSNQATDTDQNPSINKVSIFIENSGSMLGYVKYSTDYVSAVVSLSFFSEFDSTKKDFYFINGKSPISLNKLGNDPNLLKNNLNQNSYNKYGNPKYSDLTGMFEKALNYANGNDISILITDCLYDVGNDANPLTSINIEVQSTKKVFRDRLSQADIHTIVIKSLSEFNGNYYFASKKGSASLNQKRPYYILIFGKSNILNKVFTEENIKKLIPGYIAMARFMIIGDRKVPYQATSQHSIGSFKFDKFNKNNLIDAKKDRNGKGFQFTVAVDYSKLPFPDAFYKDTNNYSIADKYNIVNIYTSDKKVPDVSSFSPTHYITIHTNNNPSGKIELSLKNKIPGWIQTTNSNSEGNIVGNTNQTYGFQLLMDAITEAYEYKNKNKYLTTFNFEVKQ